MRLPVVRIGADGLLANRSSRCGYIVGKPRAWRVPGFRQHKVVA